MFVVFPEILNRQTQQHTQTDTQYDYHTLLPMLHSEGNDNKVVMSIDVLYPDYM